MFKKLVLAALLLCFYRLHAHVRDGLYFGFGIGDAVDTFHFHTRGPLTNEVGATQDSVVLNAFLGWGFTNSSHFYFGAEIGTIFPERSTQLQRPGVFEDDPPFLSFNEEVSIRDYLTADALVGLRPSAFYLLYLRGGASFTYGRLYQFGDGSNLGPPQSTDSHGAGWRVGAGINYSLTPCLGVGLDYIFTRYPHVRLFNRSEGVELKFWAYSNSVSLSTLWHF